jgi:hypothetical protein
LIGIIFRTMLNQKGKTMKVLVIGGRGVIGSAVVALLSTA